MLAANADRSPGLTGRHVLAILLGFFAFIFVVNGVFMYAALSTNSGLDEQDSFRKGLSYNDRIADDARQLSLGWTSSVELVADGSALSLAVTDRDGKPVTGLEIEGVLGRPATSTFDHKLKLAETAPGRYAAALKGVGEGTWAAEIQGTRKGAGDAVVLHLHKRLWVKPRT
jgi:nitrogen fixation protein FixH